MPRLSDIEVSQLAAVGFNAYEKADYDCTIKCLLKVIDNEPKHWRAKLYLGMAYLSTGDRLLGTFQLRFVKTNCPDAEMRELADKAMNTITAAAAQPANNANVRASGQYATRATGQYATQAAGGRFDARPAGQPLGQATNQPASQPTNQPMYQANAGVSPSFGKP